MTTVYIGCAGWNVPRAMEADFPREGAHLERYAARLPAVEIDSSFHRSHRPSTYARWAVSVPSAFRFSVKMPRAVTHQAPLGSCGPELAAFLDDIAPLGARLGCLLAQFPPSLRFDAGAARRFFGQLRERHAGAIAAEPRHPSWFESEADQLLVDLEVARVATDPARVPAAAEPGGWRGLVYYRLHGSPRTYYSSYDRAYLTTLADRLATFVRAGLPVWCIFDNTAVGAAAANARDLLQTLARVPGAMTRAL